MKKFGGAAFLFALAIGSILSANCRFSLNKSEQIKGSGIYKTETRDVKGFNDVNAGGAMNVSISAGSDYAVSVETDDNLLSHIKTETIGETLKIYSEGNLSPSEKINVKISMPEINSLHVSGASEIIASNVNADSLNLEASGASKIKIEGVAKNLQSEASGASRIDAENLKTETANVEANGASQTIVSATNQVKANASGASNIYYTGEPKDVIQNASGASSVKKK